MERKQLVGLFICSLLIWTYGNGLLPLLPVYAKKLGAESDAIGYYMSFVYISIALSTVIAGWLSDKLQDRKKLLIIAGALVPPATLLLSYLATFSALVVLSGILWFLGGMGLALISILAGLFSKQEERGKVFGSLALTGALGSLIGGLTTGPLADRYGYQTMFTVLGLGICLLPLTALILKDKPVARLNQASMKGKRLILGTSLLLLLFASTFSGIVNFSTRLGTSLVMVGHGFQSTAISSTMAISGAIVLPLPLLLGWLSDRLGRKWFLGASYLMGTIGALVLTSSLSLWHFWLVSSLMSAMFYINNGLGSALVADLVPKESLGKGMSLFGSTAWVGGIIGFGCTGYCLQNLGIGLTFFMGAFLTLIAMTLLIPIRRVNLEAAPAQPSSLP
jgi:MFS family permease